MIIIAKMINMIHFFIIISIVASIFIDSCYIKSRILALLIFLLLQYLTGYERCGLTTMEYFVLGEKYKKGFLYRLINPIIKVPNMYFDNGLLCVHILLISILLYQLRINKCNIFS